MKIIRRLLSFLLPLIGFILILITVNLYQYYRVKTDITGSIIREISNTELNDLRTFFNNIKSKLILVHDWGKNGVLDSKDIISLNKKFFPLIDHQQMLSGLIMANDKGREYFLRQEETLYLTRITSPEKNQASMLFQQWSTAENSLKKWQERTDYDPRNRPWYHQASEEAIIHWSGIYSFFQSQKQGVTASVAWQSTDGSNWVFALDILMEGIQDLIAKRNSEKPGLLFLINNQGSLFISDDGSGKESSDFLLKLIANWKAAAHPVRELVQVEHNNSKWLASFQRLYQDNTSFWVGVAATEQDLLVFLDKALFRIDAMDLSIALCGGLLMLIIIWRTGGYRHRQQPPPAPIVRLHDYINQGEGPTVEFKSSIRANLKTGKHGKEIEFAWLKAVVAFLNSSGGTLLLGVNDNGEILGLHKDGFENDDRCLLHIKNLTNQYIGAEFSSKVSTHLVTSEMHRVVMLECRPAPNPVFLKIGKNEEFYIRSGPSSTKLSPSQMISFLLQKTKK